MLPRRAAKRVARLALVLTGFCVASLLLSIATMIGIQIAMLQFRIASHGHHLSTTITGSSIPKIMHRTSQNATIPSGWQGGFDSCVEKNPEWQHMFWTDANATEFMQTHYKSFMATWHAYEYPIQRVDALRYHLLWHYGGVYADLDVGCRNNLNLLINSAVEDIALLPRTTPIGISNDVMAGSKNHPFFKQLIDGLERARVVYPSGYITVMASTGPMFVNYRLSRYLSGAHVALVKIISLELYDGGPLSIFGHLPGSSWHTNDAKLIVGIMKSLYIVRDWAAISEMW